MNIFSHRHSNVGVVFKSRSIIKGSKVVSQSKLANGLPQFTSFLNRTSKGSSILLADFAPYLRMVICDLCQPVKQICVGSVSAWKGMPRSGVFLVHVFLFKFVHVNTFVCIFVHVKFSKQSNCY